ncbi:MAG: peptidylprolyl isomerase [Oscillospiraceae bacterium]|nr:peptidylprolyl isomerase [Oscillospiraceae bacterium]
MASDYEKYENPKKKNPLNSPAFRKYFRVSLVAIIVILVFVLLIWLAGARQSGIPDDIDFIQLEEPEDDNPVVIFETNIGTISAVLYPEEAPEYYEYFTGLVESGYYDGSYVCGVVDSAYALGGTLDPDPNNDGGENADETMLQAEISDKLWSIKGSMASFVGTTGMWPFQKNCAGSTFFFINDIDDVYMDEDALKRSYGEELGSVYYEYGGIPNFTNKYTIFAQVYDGWDVFEELMNVETLDTYQPASDIVIERAYITTYGEHPAEVYGIPVDSSSDDEVTEDEENVSE